MLKTTMYFYVSLSVINVSAQVGIRQVISLINYIQSKVTIGLDAVYCTGNKGIKHIVDSVRLLYVWNKHINDN